jgi:hypothetical protein
MSSRYAALITRFSPCSKTVLEAFEISAFIRRHGLFGLVYCDLSEVYPGKDGARFLGFFGFAQVGLPGGIISPQAACRTPPLAMASLTLGRVMKP